MKKNGTYWVLKDKSAYVHTDYGTPKQDETRFVELKTLECDHAFDVKNPPPDAFESTRFFEPKS